MTVTLHKGDLPAGLNFGTIIAVDTEAMGLNNHRDRLCVVQLSAGDGTAHLVQFERGQYDAPNLKKLLGDPSVLKLFHFARFDVAIIKHYLGVECNPLWCTRLASMLCRTYTDKHGLRELCRELLGIELNKQQQSSDWGYDTLSPEQMNYAANDVLHLHALKERLEMMLKRENRLELAQKLFDFVPTRAQLDLMGWPETDIFAHN
ncbi:ribonuclease D [Micavibrio aeruginosavorus]|uniref:ribonuclease D n=1 Tax=Micavibrio aeruginosavorus TaxID=349221 RepID=UPI003F4A9574